MASTLDFDATAGASAAPADADDAYYLEQVTLDDDDDEYEYAEVEVDEEEEEGEDDEDLEKVMATIQSKADGASPARTRVEPARGEVTRRPEVLDDFIRNVLLKMQMGETLDMFQREWHRMQAEGKLSSGDMGTVPDIYLRNQQLDDQLKDMGAEIEKMKQISAAAKGTWDKFRKERDFHKMHHKRVVQEKNKLILDLKRLKVRLLHCPLHRHLPLRRSPHTPPLPSQAHYEHYEPMLKMMQTKYEAAMKEKMLVKLERDRLASRVGALEAQLRQVEAARAAEGAGAAAPAAKEPKGPRVSRLPEENRANPYLTMDLPSPKVERWGLSKTFNAHPLGVADVAAPPTKPIVATASDDGARISHDLP